MTINELIEQKQGYKFSHYELTPWWAEDKENEEYDIVEYKTIQTALRALAKEVVAWSECDNPPKSIAIEAYYKDANGDLEYVTEPVAEIVLAEVEI